MNHRLENNEEILTETMPQTKTAKVKVTKDGKRIMFSGYENHDIPLDLASQWTKNFRTQNPDPNTIKAHFFGKDAIDKILAQDQCAGIRIYYAIDETGKKHLIVAGTREDGTDIYNGLLAERSFMCPPYCGGGGGGFKNGVELNPLLLA